MIKHLRQIPLDATIADRATIAGQVWNELASAKLCPEFSRFKSEPMRSFFCLSLFYMGCKTPLDFVTMAQQVLVSSPPDPTKLYLAATNEAAARAVLTPQLLQAVIQHWEIDHGVSAKSSWFDRAKFETIAALNKQVETAPQRA